MRIVPVAVGLAALLLAGTALSAPRGKVVRVERARARTAPARFCVVTDASGEKLLCIGNPKAGEPVSLMDQRTGVMVGETRVESSQASQTAMCPGREVMLYEVNATLVSGDPDTIARGYTVALRGVSFDSRARVIEDYERPKTQLEQSVVIAVDSDGNSQADLVMYNYTCDTRGNYVVGGSSETQCWDTYVERGGHMVRTHQDIVGLCY